MSDILFYRRMPEVQLDIRYMSFSYCGSNFTHKALYHFRQEKNIVAKKYICKDEIHRISLQDNIPNTLVGEFHEK